MAVIVCLDWRVLKLHWVLGSVLCIVCGNGGASPSDEEAAAWLVGRGDANLAAVGRGRNNVALSGDVADGCGPVCARRPFCCVLLLGYGVVGGCDSCRSGRLGVFC